MSTLEIKKIALLGAGATGTIMGARNAPENPSNTTISVVATNQKLTERTLFTEFHQLIGTPEYMSPEQAEMTAEDVDTRTDIYSLGVLLYELLVGALPFGSRELRGLSFDEFFAESLFH